MKFKRFFVLCLFVVCLHQNAYAQGEAPRPSESNLPVEKKNSSLDARLATELFDEDLEDDETVRATRQKKFKELDNLIERLKQKTQSKQPQKVNQAPTGQLQRATFSDGVSGQECAGQDKQNQLTSSNQKEQSYELAILELKKKLAMLEGKVDGLENEVQLLKKSVSSEKR